MYNEDQDEEVEEEEEFHEVEEEKHKSSQESVGTSVSDKSTAVQKRKIDASNKSKEPQTGLPLSDPPSPAITDDAKPSEDKSVDDDATASVTQCDQTSEHKRETISSEAESLQTVPTATEESSKPAIEANVGDSTQNPDGDQPNKVSADALNQAANEEPQQVLATDWANIMLNSESKTPDADEIEVSEASLVESASKIDDIIKQTEELKLRDENPEEITSPEKGEEKIDHQENTDPIPDLNENSDEKTDNQIEVDDQKADSVDKKELDLDEDEENPQYIPKKGDFYEHDDRSRNVDEDESAKKPEDGDEEKDANISKKSLNQEKHGDSRRANRRQRMDADRWNHDLFRDEKQRPKNNNSHGFDNRHHDRPSRNLGESRTIRTSNAADTSQGSQEGRSRQNRDGRIQRQNQSGNNRSRERKPRRQTVRNSRNETAQTTRRLRDPINKDTRSRLETKDPKDIGGDKQPVQPATHQTSFSAPKRDSSSRDPRDSRGVRNDSRGRRRTSRDRPTTDDKLPPPNTIMPPITTWSNEDMVKAEAFSKDSPSRQQSDQSSSTSNHTRSRPNESWSQGQPSKNAFMDRSMRNHDENRHNIYNPRRYQDDSHRINHSTTASQFNDRPNHNSDWHRVNNINSYGKPNDYIVKTQTFENSRLAQANRSHNRDLRDELNERRAQSQQHFQPKLTHGVDHLQTQPMNQIKNPHYNQYGQQHFVHQAHVVPQHQASPHMAHQQLQHQPPAPQHQTQQPTSPPQQQMRAHQSQPIKQAGVQLHQQSSSSSTQAQAGHSHTQPDAQNQRQHINPQTNQVRQNAHLNNLTDDHEHNRLGSGVVGNDPMSSRPIIKTDTYTGTTGVAPPHHQPGTQHMSQHTHRGVGGSMAQQQGPNQASSHIVPAHMNTSSVQTQYYTPSNSARDTAAAAAAMASAYHGYMTGGHTVMDTTARYHMTSQQMSDHGYMTSPGQAGDVTAGSVLHQQGMYSDTSAGGTVASSAYMAQAGSTMSPASNIPVTGSGGPQPMPPISYLQHSQYPPPPYSNPYPQHQHNQPPPPPHSGQAYNPYWTYMS